MAKYSRFDPRNKKKNRHKDQYLGKGSMGRKNRMNNEAVIDDNVYEQYFLDRNRYIEKLSD